jgi:hypothetical protein
MLAFLIDRGAFLRAQQLCTVGKVRQKGLRGRIQPHGFGNDFVRAKVDKLGSQKVQPALNKWWRVALNVFGPPTTRHTQQYIKLGLSTAATKSAAKLSVELRASDQRNGPAGTEALPANLPIYLNYSQIRRD